MHRTLVMDLIGGMCSLVYAWLALPVVRGVFHMILATIPLIGRDRAAILAIRWIRRSRRHLFGDMDDEPAVAELRARFPFFFEPTA